MKRILFISLILAVPCWCPAQRALPTFEEPQLKKGIKFENEKAAKDYFNKVEGEYKLFKDSIAKIEEKRNSLWKENNQLKVELQQNYKRLETSRRKAISEPWIFDVFDQFDQVAIKKELKNDTTRYDLLKNQRALPTFEEPQLKKGIKFENEKAAKDYFNKVEGEYKLFKDSIAKIEEKRNSLWKENNQLKVELQQTDKKLETLSREAISEPWIFDVFDQLDQVAIKKELKNNTTRYDLLKNISEANGIVTEMENLIQKMTDKNALRDLREKCQRVGDLWQLHIYPLYKARAQNKYLSDSQVQFIKTLINERFVNISQKIGFKYEEKK